VALCVNDLDEDRQIDFKGKAKAFTRTYDFLATILPDGVQDWEKLSIFLNFLVPKLPAPVEDDLAKPGASPRKASNRPSAPPSKVSSRTMVSTLACSRDSETKSASTPKSSTAS
jgi:hypothetical protein